MKIVFPELDNPVLRAALSEVKNVEPVSAPDLDAAAELVKSGAADAMIAGLDYSSRDVLLSFKHHLPLKSEFFTSCFVCAKSDTRLIIADGGVCKLPDETQLFTITRDTALTYVRYFNDTPRIAMLSYSTKGSGGKNPDLEKIHGVIQRIRDEYSEWLIDGEMQLDAAVDPTVGAKKIPDSPVAGHANVLICPDLNSANILYKAMEHLGGWTMAGPIVQGFEMPLADLSRGSSVADTILTIDVIKTLFERTNA